MRGGCTSELAMQFGGSGSNPLIVAPAFHASAPYMGVPYEKRWLTNEAKAKGTQAGKGAGDVSLCMRSRSDSNSTHCPNDHKKLADLIEFELFMGQLLWAASVQGAADDVPEIRHPATQLSAVRMARQACPSRLDIINTVKAERWRLWDDGPECASGCFVKWHGNNTLAPLCVKRQQATWHKPCKKLPFGCHKTDSMFARLGASVQDHGVAIVPKVSATGFGLPPPSRNLPCLLRRRAGCRC